MAGVSLKSVRPWSQPRTGAFTTGLAGTLAAATAPA